MLQVNGKIDSENLTAKLIKQFITSLASFAILRIASSGPKEASVRSPIAEWLCLPDYW